MRRASVLRSIESILKEDPNPIILIRSDDTATANRNRGLADVPSYIDWIIFLDDDDYLVRGYLDELDSNYDIVVLRMRQESNIIPDNTNRLRFANVGINFAINYRAFEELPRFEETYPNDWPFLQKLIAKTHQKRIKITDGVFYVAEKRGWFKANNLLG